jgi:dTDP-glucose 4,6-dehydratase
LRRPLWTILRGGRVGESYNVGGSGAARNIEVAEPVCDLVDTLAKPLPGGKLRRSLITFVADRPRHDFCYAMNADELAAEFGLRPRTQFVEGLRKTVAWYIAKAQW